MIDILIPTFGRANRLAHVVQDILQATPEEHRVVFIVEGDDTETVDEVKKLSALAPHVDYLLNTRTANYAGAMNTAVSHSTADYWFAGADDLHFHKGWATDALAIADDWFDVIGTNDSANPFVLLGIHATHYLVARGYVEQYGGTLTEGPGVAYYEGYDHNFTDTEFVGVAKARVRFRPCLTSVVEHMHWEFGKSQNDATYRRGIQYREEDEKVYMDRKRAWEALSR